MGVATKLPPPVAEYEAQGVIAMRAVVDGAAATALLAEAQSQSMAGDYNAAMNMAERLPSYWNCMAPLVEVAARLMHASEVRLYNDHLFIKHPGVSVATDWHQDLPFWPLAGRQIIAAWVALTPVRRTASAVHYLPGSHLGGKHFRPAEQVVTDVGHPQYAALEPCPDYFDPAVRCGRDLMAWDMEPGDVLWHNGLTIHGAAANAPENPLRAGLTVRFVGEDVVWDPRPYLRTAGKVALEPGQPVADSPDFPLLWTASDGFRLSRHGPA